MPELNVYDTRYLVGILYFNQCEFFEAHEAWEELWADTEGGPRPFFQGLIQVAVCLHHFGNGNTRGARKLYHSSRKYLEPFRPGYLGIDLEAFLGQLDTCCREVIESEDEYPNLSLDPDKIPEIWPDPAPAEWPDLPQHDDDATTE